MPVEEQVMVNSKVLLTRYFDRRPTFKILLTQCNICGQQVPVLSVFYPVKGMEISSY